MPFIQVGDAVSGTIGDVCGDNILLFPKEIGLTREIRIARSISSLERELWALRMICGVTGATRIAVLILEELVERCMADIAASKQLEKKLSRLAKIFVEQSEPSPKVDEADLFRSQDQL